MLRSTETAPASSPTSVRAANGSFDSRFLFSASAPRARPCRPAMLLSVSTRAKVLAAMASPGELVTSIICSREESRTKIQERGSLDVRVLLT
jgi:hypothetical protein